MSLSASNKMLLKERGYKNLQDYLDTLAEENDVDKEVVYALYSMLGEEEMWDSLVTSVEDYGNTF